MQKLIPIIVGIGVLIIAGTALASGEKAFTGPHNTSATAINPQTCKFAYPEVDPATDTFNHLRHYVLYEDARHDAKMSCLTKRTPQLFYKSVYVTGTGQTVTAQCPAGYYVTGGGSHFEVEGSYPSGNDAWNVVRDHLSPRVLDVTAICVKVGW